MYIFLTIILFSVSVPVLSVHITETPPRVSTELSLLTIALFLAILCTPRARATVTIAGSPSGIAATARATATRSIWATELPFSMPAAKTIALIAMHIIPILLLTVLSSICKGVMPSSPWTILAIFPISVYCPVPVTTAVHLPFTMVVPLKRRFFLSPNGRRWLSMIAVVLVTGSDSPVRIDSSACRFTCFMIRQSAGTRSPADILTISPGTRFLE